MASTNREEKGFSSLPRELRERIIGIAIESRKGNTVFAVNERDARHLKEGLSCTACDTANDRGR